jgi:hypothetical protein
MDNMANFNKAVVYECTLSKNTKRCCRNALYNVQEHHSVCIKQSDVTMTPWVLLLHYLILHLTRIVVCYYLFALLEMDIRNTWFVQSRKWRGLN